MTDELLLDFPARPRRHSTGNLTHRDRSSGSVQFDDVKEVFLVHRLDESDDVDRQDLWYNKSDYAAMKRFNERSSSKVRAIMKKGVPFGYFDTYRVGSSDDCLMGIEHLLTRETYSEVGRCRQRCRRAVLREQARQESNPSSASSSDSIAMVSMVETRKAGVRAQKLGSLHRDSLST